MVSALDDEGVTRLTLPFTRLLVIMAMADFAGVVAASGPARRAARRDILKDISHE